MKAILVLGLLAGVALAAPLATAHVIIDLPSDSCGSPSLVIGDVSTCPHDWGGQTACPDDHGSIGAPALP